MKGFAADPNVSPSIDDIYAHLQALPRTPVEAGVRSGPNPTLTSLARFACLCRTTQRSSSTLAERRVISDRLRRAKA
jgi:hypothetical protein